MKTRILALRVVSLPLTALFLSTGCNDRPQGAADAPLPTESTDAPQPLFPSGFWATDHFFYDSDIGFRRQLRAQGTEDRLEIEKLVAMQGRVQRSRTVYEIVEQTAKDNAGVLWLRVIEHQDPSSETPDQVTAMLGLLLELQSRELVIRYHASSQDSVRLNALDLGLGGQHGEPGDEEAAEARFHELSALLGTPGDIPRQGEDTLIVELISKEKLHAYWKMKPLGSRDHVELERTRMQMLRRQDETPEARRDTLSAAGYNPFVYAMAMENYEIYDGVAMGQQFEEELAQIVSATSPTKGLAETKDGQALLKAVNVSFAEKNPEGVIQLIDNTGVSQLWQDTTALGWRLLAEGGDDWKVTGARLLGVEEQGRQMRWLSEGFEVEGRSYRPNLDTVGVLSVGWQSNGVGTMSLGQDLHLVGRTAEGALAFSQLVAQQQEPENPIAQPERDYPASVEEIFSEVGDAIEANDLGAILSLYDPRGASRFDQDLNHAQWKSFLAEIRELRQIAKEFEDLYNEKGERPGSHEADSELRILSHNGERSVYLGLFDQETPTAELLEELSWSADGRNYRPNLDPEADILHGHYGNYGGSPDAVVGRREDGTFALCYVVLETPEQRAAREVKSTGSSE